MRGINGKTVIQSLQGTAPRPCVHVDNRSPLIIQDLEPHTQSPLCPTASSGVYAPYTSLAIFALHAGA